MVTLIFKHWVTQTYTTEMYFHIPNRWRPWVPTVTIFETARSLSELHRRFQLQTKALKQACVIQDSFTFASSPSNIHMELQLSFFLLGFLHFQGFSELAQAPDLMWNKAGKYSCKTLKPAVFHTVSGWMWHVDSTYKVNTTELRCHLGNVFDLLVKSQKFRKESASLFE